MTQLTGIKDSSGFGGFILGMAIGFGSGSAAIGNVVGMKLYDAQGQFLGGGTDQGFAADYKATGDKFEAWVASAPQPFQIEVNVEKLPPDGTMSGWTDVTSALAYARGTK